jgi:hypothetical protein
MNLKLTAPGVKKMCRPDGSRDSATRNGRGTLCVQVLSLIWLTAVTQPFTSVALAGPATQVAAPLVAAADVETPNGSRVNAKSTRQYHFILTRGKERPVCQAYLHRLNGTEFNSLPVCGRPESRVESGFAYLSRKSLGQAGSNYFYPVVSALLSNQALDAAADKQQAGTAHGTQPRPLYRGDNTGASWTYESPVDIENDGTGDSVLVWNYENSVFSKCGTSEYGSVHPVPYRAGQTIYILTKDGRSIDRMRTIDIFGRPQAGTYFELSGPPGAYVRTERRRYLPIGSSESIFEYEGLFYFDTFFENDGEGDFKGERVHDHKLKDTLAVFIRQNHATHEVCELYLTDSEDYFSVPK